ATRMRARTAEVKMGHGHAVIAVPEHGPRAEKLVQRELSVKYVTSDEAELAFEVERRVEAAPDDLGPEVGCELVHMFDHRVGGLLALVVPLASVRKRIAEVLAEEARHVLSGRCERLVHRARDQHLDDGLARPALLARRRMGPV